MSKRTSGNPARRAWQPMKKGTINPQLQDARQRLGLAPCDEAWWNNLYQCIVTHQADGWSHLSIKRHDRAAVRDWRHLQQIKNEVVGPEREAVEIFPAESRLVDQANEYALWALPEGARVPAGWNERTLMSAEDNAEFNKAWASAGGGGKGRQRPWQPGLTTGVDDDRT